MSKKKKSSKKLLTKFYAALIICLAIVMAVSLFSYSEKDTTWFRFKITEDEETHGCSNLLGSVGAHIAALAYEVFGYSAIFLPLILIVFSFRFFSGFSKKGWVFLISGFILFFSSIAPILHLVFSYFYPNEDFSLRISPGGAIGLPLVNSSERFFGILGSYIMFIALLVLSLLLVTNLAIISGFIKFVNYTGIIFSWLKASFADLKDVLMKWNVKRKHSTQIKQRIEEEKQKPEPKIEIPQEEIKPPPVVSQESFEFIEEYTLPSLNLLDDPLKASLKITKQDLVMNSRILEKKLLDFGVAGKVTEVQPGPVITMYEFEPAPGIKVSRIINLSDDLALAMRSVSVRIVAPIPGKGTVGIEIPNTHREDVYLKEILQSEIFIKNPSRLCLALGKDISGNPYVCDLAKMPHLLVAGTTGAGKSVSVNAMILSLLFRATPDEVKMIMVDPKRLELSVYEDIPHLLTPVVTNPKQASRALYWAVQEMERRYSLMAERAVRNITSYNRLIEKESKPKGFPEKDEGSKAEKLPYIVIFIDELADLMMVASKNVEDSIQRLAQMARAAGIHLIMATQRPSVDVITGVIKSNFSYRISLQVSSKTDSRTILDQNGAELLLGKGDMLYMAPGDSKLTRVHGAFIGDHEVQTIVDFLKKQKKSDFNHLILQSEDEDSKEVVNEEYDEKYDEAVHLVAKAGYASISMVQRRLRIGYNRAARIIETMEKEGVIGPADGVKPREVKVREIDLE
ncbi:MAG: hypothetical protein A3C43_11810 [Candidatus Schekmanbacteria bacterium RIFCSPHIGHO2_02_FULL_38_11]|uniref:FtsK domain-containing protein n=1 Tax=Candidatus Schekmanbacteria bacterium RIFCSPLOWO2_12_FULL_38_15 TaxID=1817883 RepID=A0A1F7SGC9_9BACT|nr:MAG: hypothetical protein A2043_10750 [Candidatus Schekmanbacteria bacterium GWA2_38_9]OGL49364.1 MAG: hypothetical protein A3H37_06770 [Candidatus Schekmanbacteria bacterium RIFCSPLOWO2_02_FULL_38_14]OGL50544.1 MAG: hypothetical protein A3C43_11810 [Candidatus Schekmanbacteria bacterium RIFCSPHIGHO2_02_FULL_38_11]OGL52842.1 MAG: hypothetical protein A3G31_00390 [Candidatus Schekmanbacteria bacterium RIFCSPLOWO2_12_FULL_38_15]